ncbi:hypothetical protein B0H13DRAFT_1862561 [Mycena leptocephala]|nr:hypothetical protein B0H13DRAFT_1862561 [Mycena leptocephala]
MGSATIKSRQSWAVGISVEREEEGVRERREADICGDRKAKERTPTYQFLEITSLQGIYRHDWSTRNGGAYIRVVAKRGSEEKRKEVQLSAAPREEDTMLDASAVKLGGDTPGSGGASVRSALASEKVPALSMDGAARPVSMREEMKGIDERLKMAAAAQECERERDGDSLFQSLGWKVSVYGKKARKKNPVPSVKLPVDWLKHEPLWPFGLVKGVPVNDASDGNNAALSEADAVKHSLVTLNRGRTIYLTGVEVVRPGNVVQAVKGNTAANLAGVISGVRTLGIVNAGEKGSHIDHGLPEAKADNAVGPSEFETQSRVPATGMGALAEKDRDMVEYSSPFMAKDI